MRILIVDDEEASRYGIRRALSHFEAEIDEAESAESARAQLDRLETDLILLDVNLPGMSGLEFLRALRDKAVGLPAVIVITAHGSEKLAVEAIKSGAHDYLSKPFEIDDLRLAVKNALETVSLRKENEKLRRTLEQEASDAGPLVGKSDVMKRVRDLIAKVADTDATVLIRGESGTGKELVARALHDRSSKRREGSFVAVNCAALPSELIESELFGHEKGAFTGAAARRRGKFEQATGGTLFLDEIGDMSPPVQAKLLRAIEERAIERLGGNDTIPVDVRFVSATHRPLEQEIAENRFRADLFYRLRVVTIELPALRERKGDVPILADRFNRQASERYNIDFRPIGQAVMRRLIDFDWPGNVRELRNIVERAAIVAEGKEISLSDLPGDLSARADTLALSDSVNPADLAVPFTADFRADRREFERRYISRCLEETSGNVTKAASLLGMHRQSLQHKLRELGLGRRYVSLESE
jgi:DNA-binding NtrC family response regulator